MLFGSSILLAMYILAAHSMLLLPLFPAVFFYLFNFFLFLYVDGFFPAVLGVCMFFLELVHMIRTFNIANVHHFFPCLVFVFLVVVVRSWALIIMIPKNRLRENGNQLICFERLKNSVKILRIWSFKVSIDSSEPNRTEHIIHMHLTFFLSLIRFPSRFLWFCTSLINSHLTFTTYLPN